MKDWTEEKVKCAKCGVMTGVLEIFPGKRCLKCHEAHFETLPDEVKFAKPDFVGAINGIKRRRAK